MARKIPRPSEKKRRPATELFASLEDIARARQIAEEELGGGIAVNYTDMPKNIGAMGDSGVRTHTPVISTNCPGLLKELVEDPDALDRASRRICNETRAASRVLLDITTDYTHFEVAEDSK